MGLSPTPLFIDNRGPNATAPIDVEADMQGIGINAANAVAGTAAAIANGRMPYDPGNSNFQVVRPQQSASTGNPLGLLLLIFVLVKVFS
jgi:hypothetical protein